MKASTVIKVLTCTCLLAVSAWATSITLSAPARVGDKQLGPGDYGVKVKGSGDALEVTFYDGGRAVAACQGRYEQRSAKAASDAAVFSQNGDGSRSLVEIDFSGKKQVLVLTPKR